MEPKPKPRKPAFPHRPIARNTNETTSTMTAMAATTGRLIAPILALVLIASACSGNNDDIGTLPEAPTTPSTASTTSSSTTTTEPTATTLSELETAEAEIRAIVIEWWQFPIDYSLGEEGLGLGPTTGLLRQRIVEFANQMASDGLTLRSAETARIEISDVEVNLDDGFAEVDACTGSSDETIDAETLEVLEVGDIEDTYSSVFQLQLIDGEWKISEWLPSGVDGPSIDCEIAT